MIRTILPLLLIAALVAIYLYATREGYQILGGSPECPDICCNTCCEGASLRYLDTYDRQDQYQRLPSIWPVVDTSTTARFTALREAIEREKAKIPTTAKDDVLDRWYLQPSPYQV